MGSWFRFSSGRLEKQGIDPLTSSALNIILSPLLSLFGNSPFSDQTAFSNIYLLKACLSKYLGRVRKSGGQKIDLILL